MTKDISKDKILRYVSSNEVVFQFIDGMIEVANNEEQINQEKLLSLLRHDTIVNVYEKDDDVVRENFYDLNCWSQKNDLLFYLVDLGILICITKESAIDNQLIPA